MTQTMPPLIDLVVGTRPNIVKAAPLLAELLETGWCDPRLVFLMQHTDDALASQPLEDLGIPIDRPLYLPIGRQGYALRIGEILEAYSAQLSRDRPDVVVVFGDVDTTLAAAYAAKRQHLPLVHVEAGLRSGDRTMPEELNRLMVDAICDVYFTTSEEARHTLVECEGQRGDLVHHVGNLMIDSLFRTVDREHGASLCDAFGVIPGRFGLATFHRPSNVDDPEDLAQLLDILREACLHLPLVLPLHPRTSAALSRSGLMAQASEIPGLSMVPALRYRDFVSLLSLSRLVLTDSGGVQEETSVLGIPCLTVRTTTERPITLDSGSNKLVARRDVLKEMRAYLERPMPDPARIPLWDGRTAGRIGATLKSLWSSGFGGVH